VDGKWEWMGGWVDFEDSTDMLHHFPDPAVQDATLPSVAIVLSLLFSKDFGRKYNSVISSNQLGSPNHP